MRTSHGFAAAALLALVGCPSAPAPNRQVDAPAPPPSTSARPAPAASGAAPPVYADAVAGPAFPTEVRPPAEPIADVAVGAGYACVLRQSGAVDCWGTLPGSASSAAPAVRVLGMEGVVQLVASGFITCGRTKAGAVACILPGIAYAGPRPVAVRIEGVDDADDLAVGMGGTGTSQMNVFTACARTRARAVKCWSTHTRLGKERRARLVAGLPPARSVVVDYDFGHYGCALDDAGALHCFSIQPAREPEGDEERAALAVGKPWRVGGLPPLDRVAVTWRRGCGVRKADKKGVCFDSMDGDAPGSNDVVAKAYDRAHVRAEPRLDGAERLFGADCALRAGAVTCAPDHGVVPAGVRGAAFAIAHTVYANASCALGDDGRVRCWGGASEGALGAVSSIPGGRDAPAPVVGLRGAVDVATSGALTCALTHEGDVACWGDDGRGAGPAATPRVIAKGARSIHGGSTLCVRFADQHAECMNRSARPVALTAVAGVDALFGEGRSTHARLTSGGFVDVDAWHLPGRAREGLPGPVEVLAGDCALERAPGPVVCLEDDPAAPRGPRGWRKKGIDDATALVSGRSFTCALRKTGEAWCWGDLAGSGAEPRRVFSSAADLVRIAAGPESMCAVHASGRASCVGKATSTRGLVPATFEPGAGAAKLERARRVAVGDTHACAAHDDGLVRCWGRNELGELGDGSLEESRAPVLVPVP